MSCKELKSKNTTNFSQQTLDFFSCSGPLLERLLILNFFRTYQCRDSHWQLWKRDHKFGFCQQDKYSQTRETVVVETKRSDRSSYKTRAFDYIMVAIQDTTLYYIALWPSSSSIPRAKSSLSTEVQAAIPQ